jgi:hypothetical protein
VSIDHSITTVLIGLGIILLAWSRGIHIANLNLLLLGNVPLKTPIDITARPRLFWPSIASLILGASIVATTMATNYARDAYNWYNFSAIRNMPDTVLATCKSERRTMVGEAVLPDDPQLSHFLGKIIGEYKECAREIDYDNTGLFVDKYLAAVTEPRG